MGSRNHDGYGMMTFNGAHTTAHRASWLVWRGFIPTGQCVLHKCDTPACVNPAHLFLGTKSDNTTDAVTKGRWHGKPLQKLQPRDIIAIRSLRGVLTQAAIAKRFGVHQVHIGRILNGKNCNI
jgi:hypothetical protein